jgi:hypothetical protein
VHIATIDAESPRRVALCTAEVLYAASLAESGATVVERTLRTTIDQASRGPAIDSSAGDDNLS